MGKPQRGTSFISSQNTDCEATKRQALHWVRGVEWGGKKLELSGGHMGRERGEEEKGPVWAPLEQGHEHPL